MKKTAQILALPVLCSTLIGTAAVVDDLSDDVVPTPGVWNSNFETSLAFATNNTIPTVTFLGRVNCSHCNTLIAQLNTTTFKKWMAERKPVLIFKDAPETNWSDSLKDADIAAADAWICSFRNITEFPELNVYWRKTDGSTASYSFCGSGYSAANIIKLFDKYIGSYMPAEEDDTTESSFRAGATETTCLEANGVAETVAVPLARETAWSSKVESLIVTYPDGIVITNNVAWDAGVSTLCVDVAQNWSDDRIGSAIRLELSNQTGVYAESFIRYVAERANSPFYPKWTNETADYGEWTLDYAAAKKKVKKNGGVVMALFTGTMWCPYCYGLEKSLLDSEEFTAWAKDNRVMLVSFDQGLASSPSTAAGTQQARLLSYEAGADHFSVGQEPYGAKILRSGAYYLSGKGIQDDAAQIRMNEITKFTSAWLSPESTGARLGNPTMLLVKNDKVIARISLSRDASKNYPIAENIGRLTDALELAERSDENDDYPETTTRMLSQGSDQTATFQVNDRNECFTLSAAGAGTYTISADAPAGKDIILSLYSDSTLLAIATNDALTAEISSSMATSTLKLKLAAYPTIPAFAGVSSVFDAVVRMTFDSTSESSRSDGVGFGTQGLPCFGWEEYDLSFFKSAAGSNSFNLVNLVKNTSKFASTYWSGTVRLLQKSGALPPGMAMRLDSKSGRALLTGTPTKSGTYTFSFAVYGRTRKSYAIGPVSTFTVHITDLTSINPALGKARSETIALYDGNRLTGILKVAMTKTGAISATHIGTEGTYSLNGYWSGANLSTKAVFATLAHKNGISLSLTMQSDGRLLAELSGPRKLSYFADEQRFSFTGTASATDSVTFTDWKGVYGVTFPNPTDSESSHRGTAAMTLKFTSSSALKKGIVTYSGHMANGTAFSGSATLKIDEDGYALLPIFVRTSKDVFATTLRIRPNAKLEWDTPETEETIRQVSENAGAAYHLHRESSLTYLNDLETYGRYIATASTSSIKPTKEVSAYGFSDQLDIVADDTVLGTIQATAKRYELLLKSSSLTSLTLTKSTGAFMGSATVLDSNGKEVTGRIYGVLMPGWYDICGCTTLESRPYGSGTLCYSDNVNGKCIIVSMPVDIVAHPIE